MPNVLKGIPASPGIVVGPVHLLKWQVPEVPATSIEPHEVEHEVERLRIAFARSIERLRSIRERALRTAGEAEAAIFEVQISIIEDAELRGRVEAAIGQQFSLVSGNNRNFCDASCT